MAAVLAAGRGAALGHLSGADLWGVRRSTTSRVSVVLPGGGSVTHAGVRAHRHVGLRRDDFTVHCGIPVTNPSRTMLDSARHLTDDQLFHVLNEAEHLRLFDLHELHRLLERHPGHPGRARLRRTLLRFDDPQLLRSELERRFADLLQDTTLPRPRFNAWIEGMEVDVLFPQSRLVIELDGYRWHSSRRGFDNDRERARRLLLAGWRTERFSWTQVVERPADVLAALRVLLDPSR